MNPEQYWIDFGQEPIGLDVLRDGENARQAETYRTVAQLAVKKYRHAVLDIGANYGILEDWLFRAGFNGKYHGIDSNPHAIEKAHGLGHDVELGNIRSLPDTLRGYDVIVVKDVIEHLENYQLLRNVFDLTPRWVILAVYLPFHDEPDTFRLHSDGHYTNIYNRQGVIGLAYICGYHLAETIVTHETNGTENAIYVWKRM